MGQSQNLVGVGDCSCPDEFFSVSFKLECTLRGKFDELHLVRLEFDSGFASSTLWFLLPVVLRVVLQPLVELITPPQMVRIVQPFNSGDRHDHGLLFELPEKGVAREGHKVEDVLPGVVLVRTRAKSEGNSRSWHGQAGMACSLMLRTLSKSGRMLFSIKSICSSVK